MARRVKVKMSTRLMKKRARRTGFSGSKRCRFSSGEVPASAIDFKNVDLLSLFITERGKILPSRISGTSAFYQREISREIKKARMMALLPYTSKA